jgi:protein-S-isoprenylcysteine O-methyltransferase Ste14
MGLDIRWPIGLMFTLLGAMLVVYGLFTGSNAEMYKHSLGMNVNLSWGVLLLVFGGTMLFLAWRGSKQAADDSSKKTGAGAKDQRK